MSMLRYAILAFLISSAFLRLPVDEHQSGFSKFEGSLNNPTQGAFLQQPAPLDTNAFIECAKSATEREQFYISNLLRLYRQYAGSWPDTLVYEIGDIDGDGKIDTLRTRIFMDSEDVHVFTQWYSHGEVIWQYDHVNPYAWISNNHSELFAWDQRSPWVVFAVGVLEAKPKLVTSDTYPSIDIETAANRGLFDLNRLGYSIAEEDYLSYLKQYTGLLIEYGGPDPHPKLEIWFEPLKRFITYYSP